MSIFAPIHNIFVSFQGEGKKTGTPCVFVRFAGCRKCCSFCDTPGAISTEKAIWMDAKSILHTIKQKTKNSNFKNIVITGGEPFENAFALRNLIELLQENDYNISIETSGLSEYFFQNYSDEPLKWEAINHILDFFPKIWLTLSPKIEEPAPIFFTRANEIKLLVEEHGWSSKYLDYDFMCGVGLHKIILQPIWDQGKNTILTVNKNKCLNLAKEHGLRVSFQMHKYLGIE